METEESGAFGEATDILSSETTGQPAPEIVTDSETEGGDSEFQDNEDDFIRATNEEIRQVEARLATLFGDVPPPVEAAETTEVVLPRKVHPNQLKLELGLSTSMVQITAKSVAGTEQYSDEELDAAAEEFCLITYVITSERLNVFPYSL